MKLGNLYKLLYTLYKIMNNASMAGDQIMGRIESRLSAIMGARRMDISELAEKAGIAYGTAHSLYHHKNKQIHFNVIARVCEALDVQPGDIFVYVPDGEEEQ